jgi:hypothetical protein
MFLLSLLSASMRGKCIVSRALHDLQRVDILRVVLAVV